MHQAESLASQTIKQKHPQLLRHYALIPIFFCSFSSPHGFELKLSVFDMYFNRHHATRLREVLPAQYCSIVYFKAFGGAFKNINYAQARIQAGALPAPPPLKERERERERERKQGGNDTFNKRKDL